MRGISNNGLTLVSPVRNVNTIASTGPAPVTFFTLKASTHKASKPTEFDFKNLTLEHLAASSLQKSEKHPRQQPYLHCYIAIKSLVLLHLAGFWPHSRDHTNPISAGNPDLKMHGPPPGYFRTTGDFCCSRPWMSWRQDAPLPVPTPKPSTGVPGSTKLKGRSVWKTV